MDRAPFTVRAPVAPLAPLITFLPLPGEPRALRPRLAHSSARLVTLVLAKVVDSARVFFGLVDLAKNIIRIHRNLHLAPIRRHVVRFPPEVRQWCCSADHGLLPAVRLNHQPGVLPRQLDRSRKRVQAAAQHQHPLRPPGGTGGIDAVLDRPEGGAL